jgi:hypothetical protein
LSLSFRIVNLPRKVADRGGDLGAGAGSAGRPAGVMLGKQAARQRGRVINNTCNADCLVGQWSGLRAIGGHRVLQLAGERRGHLCLQRCAGALEGGAAGQAPR